MSKLQKDILFICLAILSLLIFANLILIYSDYDGPNLTLYGLLLIVTIVFTTMFFCYLLWVRLNGVTLILIGDHYANSDNQDVIDSLDIAMLNHPTRVQIMSKVALEQDSLKIRLHLQQLKGSFFYPPKILINLNINSLLLSDKAQVFLLTANLNRVLEQLRHWRTEQKIDLVVNTMQSVDGYNEFSDISGRPMHFNAKSNLHQQLRKLQNSTKSLIKFSPANFLNYLKFAHTMPSFLAQIDELLANLLIANEDADTHVYFSSSRK